MNKPRRKRCCSCKELKAREDLDINDVCRPCMQTFEDACRGCGKPAGGVQYCEKCVGSGAANCPHNKKPGECDHCDHMADLAYDAAREG